MPAFSQKISKFAANLQKGRNCGAPRSLTENTGAVYYQKEQSHTLLLRSLAAMEAAAVAALAAIVDHDHACALNELLQQNIQLRQQLEQQRQQLEQQRQQLEQQRIQMRQQELDIARLRNTIAWAHHDLQMGEIETAEQRLMGYVED